jgi:diacylglycerol kinase family enzyme
MQFTVTGSAGQTTALSFVNSSNNTNTFQFNNGSPAAATNTGQFTVFAPTAASVSVSGRVMNSIGRGIRNVSITLTDSSGNQRETQTTSFGYYNFDNVTAGETVTITAKARRFKFVQSSIVRTTNESVTGADYVSEQ